MIEVKARLLRGSVFFAGECIDCEIIFTNVADGKKGTCNQPCNHSNNECLNQSYETERLAWASSNTLSVYGKRITSDTSSHEF